RRPPEVDLHLNCQRLRRTLGSSAQRTGPDFHSEIKNGFVLHLRLDVARQFLGLESTGLPLPIRKSPCIADREDFVMSGCGLMTGNRPDERCDVAEIRSGEDSI